MGTKIFVPDEEVLKKEILDETRASTYAMHPGNTKMFQTLVFMLLARKKDNALFISRCLIC